MVRGGKVSGRSNFRKRARSKDEGSDDSDEDYVVSDEENEVTDDSEYCSSLEECASEESLGCFAEGDEEKEKEVRKLVRPAVRRGSFAKEKVGDKTAQKRRRLTREEEDDEDYEGEEEENSGSFAEGDGKEEKEKEAREVVGTTARRGLFAREKVGDKTSQKRKQLSHKEEDDEDYEGEEEEEEEDDDDEFVLDEDECLDEEEELTLSRKKNMKANKKGLQKRPPGGGWRNRKNYAVSKEPLRKNSGKKRRLKRKNRVEVDDDDEDDEDYADSSDGDFRDSIPPVRKRSKTSLARRKRKYHVSTDSDHASSGSSDHEYTISEEEREQVMEARKLYGSLKTALRSSSSLGKIQDGKDLGQDKNPPVQKGKEKVEELKIEVVKQVCGICLSEEDKRRLRGKLDCCIHYFCFSCIMEWSKVESRCPLCKQRFKTISKPARSAAGVDLRGVVIQVPERDQVYQPSEEELRSYLDPYENVICSECHQGGDDGLMLLCDLCDSSAHTYCVGLGQEVPEGNWYCDGCRPVALVSSSSQAQDSLSDQRTISNNFYNRPSPLINLGESGEPTLMASPRTPFTQGFGSLSSPRLPVADVSAASLSGAGAPTISGRRWIHRHIHNLLSGNRMNPMAMRVDGMSTANLANDFLNSQIDQCRESTVQQSRMQDNGTLYTIFEESSQANPPSSLQRGIFSPRLGHLGRQAVQGPSTATIDTGFNLTLWPELAGTNSISGNEHINQWSPRSNIVLNGSPHIVKEETDFSLAKEQLQTMVRSHLKNLSRDNDLGNNFKDIARHSMQTILAACGLEHMKNEVHSVPPPSICPHVDRLEAGQRSLMKGCCPTCFDSFVKDVVKRIMDTSLPQWLSLGR